MPYVGRLPLERDSRSLRQGKKGRSLEISQPGSTGIAPVISAFVRAHAMCMDTAISNRMEECMFSKLLLASATIGLLLAGPQKASAQVVHACVNSIGNVVVVAANANCPPNVGSSTWTKTTLSTTPGLLAGRAFQCVFQQTIAPGGSLSFIPSLSGVNFGSSISTTGTPPFNTITLQPGIYSINLSPFFSSFHQMQSLRL